MKSFAYKAGQLGFETSGGWRPVADFLSVATHPVYLYNALSIEQRIQTLSQSLQTPHRCHYAVKANSHPGILRLMHKAGYGVDVVSGGEARWALDQGFQPADIIFSGVAKSRADLTMAVELGFYQINIESIEELERLGAVATQLQKTAQVALRLNPNIKVDTHPYITTGFRENKFGISEYQVSEALEIFKKYPQALRLQGLSSHIGSQIRDLSPILDSLNSLLKTAEALAERGFILDTLDIGGGLGLNYLTDDETEELTMMKDFGREVSQRMQNFKGTLLLEPGRCLVGRSGLLCAQVEYVKNNGYKNFLILNTGMNHLMRPSLYKAFHRILPLTEAPAGTPQLFDVVGPICESSDVLGHDRMLTAPQEGDWFAIMDSGAYGMSMASFYNRHPFPQEILI